MRQNSDKGVTTTIVQGAAVYIEHRPTGDVKVKSNSIQALSIVSNTAVITAKATVSGVGNYKIQAVLVDNGDPGTGMDQFGLRIVNPSEAVVPDLTFSPRALVGGNTQVPHK